jgi:hypothetical protein
LNPDDYSAISGNVFHITPSLHYSSDPEFYATPCGGNSKPGPLVPGIYFISGFTGRRCNMESRPWQRHYDYNVPTTIRYPRLAAHELLGIPVNTFPDKPATSFYGTDITFYELRRQVLQMANANNK